jgi:hypothetical protein
MNVRRRLMLLVVLGAWLATVPPATAHRVDEFLQATRLSIDVARVDLEIDLTAGIALASTVFAGIDTDGDGVISGAEGDSYARKILRSVVLKVNGSPVAVTFVDGTFPEFREMSLGVGIIRLRATAEIPAAGAGRHQVYFLNTSQSESSVYLVNALVPANPHLQIANQRRDVAQHGLTLDYTVASEAATDRTLALLAGLVMAGCLFLRRANAISSSSPQRT